MATYGVVVIGTGSIVLAVITCPGVLFLERREEFIMTGSTVPGGITFSANTHVETASTAANSAKFIAHHLCHLSNSLLAAFSSHIVDYVRALELAHWLIQDRAEA
jgi:hypothetical protein